MNPKLSIITINFNNAIGLKRTMESVFSQTYSGFEYIIIDGGSIDESVKIIQEFQALYVKENKNHFIFNWISEPDSGIYNAMNKGITHTDGEYCLFLNSGDYLTNNSVLEMVFKSNLKEDIVYGNLIVEADRIVIEKIHGKGKLTFLDIYCSLIKHQASFIRRALFDKFGLYNENLKISSDWEFFLKTLAINTATYKYIDLDITCFDNNGISNNNPELCAFERKEILNKYFSPLMQEDLNLLKKFKGIHLVNQTSWGWFLFRCFVKIIKTFSFN